MTSLLDITGPVYLLMGLGFVAVRSGWIAATDLRVMGRYVAQFCIPALLLRTLSHLSLQEVMHFDFLAVYAAGSLLTMAITWLISRRLLQRPLSLAAIHGMGASSSNSAFIGYPILQQVIGPAAGLALALVQLVENLLVIPLCLLLADVQEGGESPLQVVQATLRNLVRNPMILAIAAGLTLSASGLMLPVAVDRAVSLIASAASPTALFVIGGTLVGLKLTGLRAELALVAGGKLLLHPLCMLGFLWLWPPTDPLLRTAALVLAGMPMLSIYPVLAQRFGHDRFTAAALLAATVGSFFTVNALISLLPL